jgi:hypothetical protein
VWHPFFNLTSSAKVRGTQDDRDEIYTFFMLILGSLQSSLGSPVQFCRKDQIQGYDICIALSVYPNNSSASNDFHLTLSGYFLLGKGWGAFGTRQNMDGAMMFVFYPSEFNNGK